MQQFFSIDGFWKDDKTKFENYIVTNFDDAPINGEIKEEDIFYFGLSEEEIKEAIKEKWSTVFDFAITSYHKHVKN